jgi:hypothetical protein
MYIESIITTSRHDYPMPGYFHDALNTRGLMEAYLTRPLYQ